MISCFHNKSFPTSLLLVALLILSGCNQRANIYFEKRLKLPGLATYDQKAKLAGYVVPTKNQLEWQQMELIAFAYFGINTFTGNEWGAGDDSSLYITDMYLNLYSVYKGEDRTRKSDVSLLNIFKGIQGDDIPVQELLSKFFNFKTLKGELVE